MVVLGVCTVLIVVCALVGVLVPDLPDFSDPLLVSNSFLRCLGIYKSLQRPFIQSCHFVQMQISSCRQKSVVLHSLQKGFEPRGTAIGQRLVTWNNMVKNTGYKATLANYPFKYADEQAKK